MRPRRDGPGVVSVLRVLEADGLVEAVNLCPLVLIVHPVDLFDGR